VEFSQYTNEETSKKEDKQNVETLQETLHSKPVGVKFHFSDNLDTDYATPHEPVRFCQAVKIVKETSTNLQLTRDMLNCAIAKYVQGFENNETLNETIYNLVAMKRFDTREKAKKALIDVPRITGAPSSVTLSVNDFSPDIFILYLKPVHFMQVVQAHQKLYHYPIELKVPSIVPVCGGCAVTSYLSQRITASFGCDDSRELGDIDDNQLVMGVPYCMVGPLAKSLEEMKGGKSE